MLHDLHDYMISFILAYHKTEPVFTTCTLRNYRKIDKVQFTDALINLVSSQPQSIDVSLFEWYVSGITRILDTCAPSSKKSRPLKLRRP